jgi:CheY-like chemotaxis protein
MSIKTAGVSVPSSKALNSMPVGLPLKSADEIALDSETSWILVVDDDWNVLQLVASMALRLGYRPTTAAHPLEALWHLDQTRFDLVITDLVMPLMDGCQLAREIKKKQPWAKAIIMTGQCERAVEEQVDGIGVVDGLLFKPFNLIAMKEVIALAQHPYLRKSGRTRSGL